MKSYLPIYTLMRGFGLPLSFGAATVVLVILRLDSIPPQAPGNVGSFQFFTILGLQLFGVPRGEATGFATLLFVVVTVPLWAAGFIALIATRMRLQEIHKDAHETLANGSAPAQSATSQHYRHRSGPETAESPPNWHIIPAWRQAEA